jgi:hypothetical protein
LPKGRVFALVYGGVLNDERAGVGLSHSAGFRESYLPSTPKSGLHQRDFKEKGATGVEPEKTMEVWRAGSVVVQGEGGTDPEAVGP